MMKKLTLLALSFWAVYSMPLSADSVATIKQIQLAADSAAIAKNVAVLQNNKSAQLSENGAINLNDVIDSGQNKEVTLKLQNGAQWILEDNTRFVVRSYAADKATYEILSGSAHYEAGDKVATAVIKISKKEYVASGGTIAHFTLADEDTNLKVLAGTIHIGAEIIDTSRGSITIDEQGTIESSKPVTKITRRGVRG